MERVPCVLGLPVGSAVKRLNASGIVSIRLTATCSPKGAVAGGARVVRQRDCGRGHVEIVFAHFQSSGRNAENGALRLGSLGKNRPEDDQC